MDATFPMPSPAFQLAIVVPAYKDQYLGEALRSIAAQSDQRFQLYVCDDGSPEDLRKIFKAAELSQNAVFHRFEENVGGRSVVESWRRSVALSTEPWIWLFSDDDLMHPNCVAAFYQALAQDSEPINIYRFSTVIIDGCSRVVHINPPNPERESVDEFIYHRLTNQRFSLAPEHIFRRSAYEARGGFVEFAFALGSDDATWIKLAGSDTPFRGISGPRVHWRLSRINISAFASQYVAKMQSLVTFAAWLADRPEIDRSPALDGRPPLYHRKILARKWFLRQIRKCPHFFLPQDADVLAKDAAQKLGVPRWLVWLILAGSNLQYLTSWLRRAILRRID